MTDDPRYRPPSRGGTLILRIADDEAHRGDEGEDVQGDQGDADDEQAAAGLGGAGSSLTAAIHNRIPERCQGRRIAASSA
jgi:hypothetical protein